jgi:hypothetical protein
MQLHLKFNPAGNHSDFTGNDVHNAELGPEGQASALRDYEEITIRVLKEILGHGFIACIKMHGVTGLCIRVSVGGKGHESTDEIGFFLGNGQRVPTQLRGGV